MEKNSAEGDPAGEPPNGGRYDCARSATKRGGAHSPRRTPQDGCAGQGGRSGTKVSLPALALTWRG
ncbi:MAG: hypothetical protein O7G31_17320 [Calditrichaeota bacterium]|nr:hypothetical protein [Calditrichota bacterium]